MTRFFYFISSCLLLSSCTNQRINCPTPLQMRANFEQKQQINQTQLLADLKILSSSQMEGRRPATEGSHNAQKFIIDRFQHIGLQSFNTDYRQPFNYGLGDSRRAVNLLGYQRGNEKPDEYIVISAHYDHLGKSGHKIYYGADDNASGVSAMLAIAEYFAAQPTKYSIIYLATDAEEDGLFGAKAFVDSPPVNLNQIKLNLNIDMVSHGGLGKILYVAGTRRNEQFKPLINQITPTASVCLRAGHEGRQHLKGASVKDPDWRNASDHAPFSHAGIPYLYFGVDLHRDYHEPSDTFENIDEEFFSGAVETILETLISIENAEQYLQ